MSELPYFESLDLILSRMFANHGHGRVEWVVLCDEMKPEILPDDLRRMVETLKTEGLLEGEPMVDSRWLSVTVKGKSFSQIEGGFKGRQMRESIVLKNSTEALDISKQALKISQRNTNWVIIAAIAAIIGVLITIYFHYFK